MVTRDHLHELIDAIPEDHLAQAVVALEQLTESYTRLNAPEDDEPESESERLAVIEARAQHARGEVLSHDEVKRRLGMS